MWRSMSGQGRQLTMAALVGSAASICSVALLAAAAWLITTAAGMPPVLTLTVAAVSVRFFALGRAVFRYVERLVGHDAAFRGLTGLRVHVYLRLEQLAPVGLTRFVRGDLLTRLVADVDAALDLPLRVVLPWVQAGIVLAGCVAGLAWLLPGAAVWIGIVGLVALLGSPWLVGAIALHAERRVAGQQAQLTALVVTTLTGVADLAAFGMTDRALARIAQADAAVTGLLRRESTAVGIGGGQAIVLQGLAVTGALALAVPAVASGTLGPAWLAVTALLPLALFDVLGNLPDAALALQRLRGSADRLAELDLAPDPVHRAEFPLQWADRGGPGTPAISVDGLSASWPGSFPDGSHGSVLHHVSFTVPAGGRLTVVGPSGSGKSTLIAVLMGFLDYSGSVRVDGNEVRESDPEDLRRRIGVLAQRTHIFDTTIEENVCLGRPVRGDEQVWQALHEAQLATAIRAMPLGLRTNAGTFGNTLSGGEAQRLSIARLMITAPGILLLDEPTEHLDAATAASVDDTLRRLTQGRTRVLVTHRVASIDSGEQVIVLEGGRVTQFGTAAELCNRGGWLAAQADREAGQADLATLVATLPVGRAVSNPWRALP